MLAATAQAAPVDRGLQGGSYNAGHGGSNCCGSPTQMSDRDFQEAITGRRPHLGTNNAVRGSSGSKSSSQGSSGKGHGFGSCAGDNC